MVDPVSVHEVHEELHRSQTLLMYTDGATDAGHPEHPLEEEGLCEVCHRSRDLTLPALLEVIQQAALERTGGGLRDDLALLAVRMPRPLGGLA
jgi:serine phosphatase RsbU (regulator of sigma subunit)